MPDQLAAPAPMSAAPMPTTGASARRTRKRPRLRDGASMAAIWATFEPAPEPAPADRLQPAAAAQSECSHCQSPLAYDDVGFQVCTNRQCGVIHTNVLDSAPEWRFFGADDSGVDPSRCGMPINPLLEQSSYGCRVMCGGKSSHTMRKIRQYTEWQSMPYKEQSLYHDFQTITAHAQNAGLCKKLIDDALYYHKKLSAHEQSFRGDNKQGLMIGALAISCHVNHCSRTTRELAAFFGVDVAVATNGCKRANTILNQLENDMDSMDKTDFGKTDPDTFIERYCSRLHINAELTHLCRFVAMKVTQRELLSGNTPNSVAAGVIYFVSQRCRLPITKRDVHHISDISEVTINKCWGKLSKVSGELIPQVVIEKYGGR